MGLHSPTEEETAASGFCSGSWTTTLRLGVMLVLSSLSGGKWETGGWAHATAATAAGFHQVQRAGPFRSWPSRAIVAWTGKLEKFCSESTFVSK